MQFSKLRLNGFKSFVDPTDLIITDGLTGVVGPNGCGKSNLLEALRWVMGESRAKAMRGGGMEDVIFAGASSRPARNFAEVSLVLDNQDRTAPSGFNESDTIEIVRRITRDAGSAYKLNTKDVRARDVQMLFADASTGAQSPALVRQGQIAELISAKPKARRRILEEAAGISGLYQRRHEAELKLKGTETNLERLDDVLETLATQMGQLERQARQAARYRTIGNDLRHAEGLLLYRRWREANLAHHEAERLLTERVKAAAAAEGVARAASKWRETCEAKLPPLREEETIASAILQRFMLERAQIDQQEAQARGKIHALKSRIDQLGRDIERETGLNKDANETIDRLTWEQEQLIRASDGFDEALETANVDLSHSRDTLRDVETKLAQDTEAVAALAAEHQTASRALTTATAQLEKNQSQLAQTKATLQIAKDAAGRAQGELEAATQDLNTATRALETAETQSKQAEQSRTDAQLREDQARTARASIEGEQSAMQSEVSALERLVNRDRAEGAQLLDDLRVKPGYEKALAAALADDLRAPKTEKNEHSGWFDLTKYAQNQSLPSEVECFDQYVKAPELLSRRLKQIGFCSDLDAQKFHESLKPGQCLVTLQGDLWRWDGYFASAQDQSSTTALKLERVNRLTKLQEDLAQLTSQVKAAVARHDEQKSLLNAASNADQTARLARREADQTMADCSRKLSRAEAERNIAEGKVETLEEALVRHENEAITARENDKIARAALDVLGDLDEARSHIEQQKSALEDARATMMSKRATLDGLQRAGEARQRRNQEITKEVSGWRHRLESADKRVRELEERRTRSVDELVVAENLPEKLSQDRMTLNEKITDAETRRAAAADALAAAETEERAGAQDERDQERLAGEAREARVGAQARRDAAGETERNAAERIREEMDRRPEELLKELDVDPEKMPSAEQLEHDVARLKRQRDALGAVNLRAEDDIKEVASEHENLTSEKQDLEEAIKTLRSGIAGLNKEGRERLLAAFDQVNQSFAVLFQHLFGGGEARLELIESDDPLDAGLEIMCQPPGKNLSTLSLLSGGEQTLTAMALIFAVFLANPAPICVLDEVDAPLDDANVTRFCDLLDEMTRRTNTRFLIITHHAVTMSRMDRLFGVTMAEQGVSQLVSVDLKKAESLVA